MEFTEKLILNGWELSIAFQFNIPYQLREFNILYWCQLNEAIGDHCKDDDNI